jgi:hypothetical protein
MSTIANRPDPRTASDSSSQEALREREMVGAGGREERRRSMA